MNEHIRLGNEALKSGDYETAKIEFYAALGDKDELVRRIAQNRLMELFPTTVIDSQSSGLYHREDCRAGLSVWYRNTVRFKHWMEAEENGYRPCSNCSPPRLKPFSPDAS